MRCTVQLRQKKKLPKVKRPSAFAQHFQRAVFNNRITGEAIIAHDKLIPNAARTDYEPSPVRDALCLAFDNLSSRISSWAEAIQEDLKSKEDLDEISERVFDILKTIPARERDVPYLLTLNTELSGDEKRLDRYKKSLLKGDKVRFERTKTALQQAKSMITEILARRRQSAKERQRRIREGDRAQAHAPTKADLVYSSDKPKDLLTSQTANTSAGVSNG